MTYQIGDTLAAPDARGLWAEIWPPSWHIFTVPPRCELPASAWLARNGVAECWYPSETAFRRNRYKPNERIPYQRAIAPGYLFAVLPMRPHWDILMQRGRMHKVLRGVVSENGYPVSVPESIILAMAQVPQRLEEIRQAEDRKTRIAPGDKAEVEIAGIQWAVEVASIHSGIASFILPLMGGSEVTAPISSMRKTMAA